MLLSETYELNNPYLVKIKLFSWADKFDKACCLDSNRDSSNVELIPSQLYKQYDVLVGVGEIDSIIVDDELNGFDRLKEFYNKHKQWLFGHLSYELKNETENLSSSNLDHIHAPSMHFFVPETIIKIIGNKLTISSIHIPNLLFEEILTTEILPPKLNPISINTRLSRDEYIKKIESILERIHYGDIYELNFCQEFYAENVYLDPIDVYLRLNEVSPTPFAGYYKFGNFHLLCASPERFLKKIGDKLISQPIKGTIKRGNTKDEDDYLRLQLQNDEKERSENIMITDLVRNDLSKNAQPGSVHVEELCGVYAFKQVHQLISTISCILENAVHPIDVIKNAFPMGSMTGAPKLKAMELIEEYETTKRGLYSGTIGYFSPDRDFDFNVVIRSIIYNNQTRYLSFITGSAITSNSIPENEYEECLLKAKAIMEVIS